MGGDEGDGAGDGGQVVGREVGVGEEGVEVDEGGGDDVGEHVCESEEVGCNDCYLCIGELVGGVGIGKDISGLADKGLDRTNLGFDEGDGVLEGIGWGEGGHEGVEGEEIGACGKGDGDWEEVECEGERSDIFICGICDFDDVGGDPGAGGDKARGHEVPGFCGYEAGEDVITGDIGDVGCEEGDKSLVFEKEGG